MSCLCTFDYVSQFEILTIPGAKSDMCALFFIKKGFPFISVLDGGFAAAHAWIARDCDYLSLTKVLVDYDEQASLFADLERAYQTQKEYSNVSTRRKTTLALQKLIDNSMTRISLLEKGIEEFTERPRDKSSNEVNEIIDAVDITKLATNKDTVTNVSKNNLKIPPMNLFKKQDASTAKNESDENNAKVEVKSTSDSTEKEVKNNEGTKNFKAGFNKAVGGLKNIRIQRGLGVARDQNSNNLTKKEMEVKETSQKNDSNDGDKTEQVHAFKLGNINFSRKNNMFVRKPNKSNSNNNRDDDLEREIEASLTKPEEVDSTKNENKDKSTSDHSKNSQSNPFKKPFPKINFSSISRPARQSSNSIIREEESLFFDEESLDDTEDSSNIQDGDETTFV